MDEALRLKEEIAKVGANLLVIKQKHLGSDKLPSYIQNFTDYLKSNGVTVIEGASVFDINDVTGFILFHIKKVKRKIQ